MTMNLVVVFDSLTMNIGLVFDSLTVVFLIY
jgi:hypothetical protein